MNHSKLCSFIRAFAGIGQSEVGELVRYEITTDLAPYADNILPDEEPTHVPLTTLQPFVLEDGLESSELLSKRIEPDQPYVRYNTIALDEPLAALVDQFKLATVIESTFQGLQPKAVCVIGVRLMALDEIDINAQYVSDQFDDLLVVAVRNPITDGYVATVFHATVDSGTKYTKSPLNPGGVAMWAPGIIEDSHKWGLHKGRYEALVQSKPVKFFRDNTLDDTQTYSGLVMSGHIGLNIHAADMDPFDEFDYEKDTIGPWSAGCWVIPSSVDYRRFHSVLTSTGASKFTTNLVIMERVSAE